MHDFIIEKTYKKKKKNLHHFLEYQRREGKLATSKTYLQKQT